MRKEPIEEPMLFEPTEAPPDHAAEAALGDALTKELKYGHRAVSIHGPLFETQMELGTEMTVGRWYECMGGTGLEIRTGESSWRVAGYIQKRKNRWDIRVNPYQDEGYVLTSCNSLEEAKADFLRRLNVTQVELVGAS